MIVFKIFVVVTVYAIFDLIFTKQTQYLKLDAAHFFLRTHYLRPSAVDEVSSAQSTIELICEHQVASLIFKSFWRGRHEHTPPPPYLSPRRSTFRLGSLKHDGSSPFRWFFWHSARATKPQTYTGWYVWREGGVNEVPVPIWITNPLVAAGVANPFLCSALKMGLRGKDLCPNNADWVLWSR